MYVKKNNTIKNTYCAHILQIVFDVMSHPRWRTSWNQFWSGTSRLNLL